MAPQVGAATLQRANGGRGVLIGGVPGVKAAKVVVLGGGVSGLNAAQIAVGMGANVTILDLNAKRLAEIDRLYQGRLQTLDVQPVRDRAGDRRGRPGDRRGPRSRSQGAQADHQRHGRRT